MSRVLVIGASGFIGSHLTRALAARGDDVHILLRETSTLARLSDLADAVTIHRAELRDRAAMDAVVAAAAPEVVFYLAAQTRWRDLSAFADVDGSLGVDLIGLLTVVKALAAAERPPKVMLRAGSIAEYGDGPGPHLESQRESPLNAYGASLVAGTHYLRVMQPRLGFAAITTRLSLTYGPRQDEDFLVPQLIRDAVAGRTITLRRPDDCCDLVHVDEVVAALLLLAERAPTDLPIVNISTGVATKVGDIAAHVIAALGRPAGLVVRAPAGGGAALSAYCSSPTLLEQRFGWRAQIDWRAGVERLARAALDAETA